MIRLEDAKRALLWIYYRNLVEDRDSDCIRLHNAKILLPGSISSNLLYRAATDLLEGAYLKHGPDDEFASSDEAELTITNDGIKFVESMHDAISASWRNLFGQYLPETLTPDPNAWKSDDSNESISSSQVEALRRAIEELRAEILKHPLDQQDQADAISRVDAAARLAEAPHPVRSAIGLIINSFVNSFVGEFAKHVLKLLLPS